MSEIYVYSEHRDNYVGKCYHTVRHGRVSSVFTYDDAYIVDSGNWNIDPALSLTLGSQPVAGELLGAFRDSCPDRWGRMLINRRHRLTAIKGQTQRTLNEVDYLLGVSDITRQGALRFCENHGSDFLYPAHDVPKLIELPKLLHATDTYIENNDIDSIHYLLEAGSSSLGGARPKAAVRNDATLFLAKFPHKNDEWDVIGWEWVALALAKEAGIHVPNNELIQIDKKNVLLLERFDRKAEERIGYISAMTLLGLSDGETADYMEIALALRDISIEARKDLEELFRRIILSILINNTDDHLRNHGFIREGCGWRLSPVFDINPNPDLSQPRATGIFGEIQNDKAIKALLVNADCFDLTMQRAEKIAHEVTAAIKAMEQYAKTAHISKQERGLFQI